MAGEDLTLKLIIQAIDQFGKQFDDLSKRLGNVEKHTEDLNKSSEKQTSTIANLRKSWTELNSALNTVQFVMGKLQQVYRATIGESVNLAARNETLGVVLNLIGQNAGYSSERLEVFKNELQETGISILGSQEALTKFIGAELDLADAADVARVAQNAAVIENQNSTVTFNRLTDAIQTGNSMVLRGMGLYVDFAGAYQKFAEEAGRSVTSLTAVEKTQIRLNEVMRAGENISGAYEAAMGTAGKQVLSMERYVEDLKVEIGDFFLPVYTEAVNETKNFIQELGDAVYYLKQVTDQGEEFRWVVDGLGVAMTVLLPALAIANWRMGEQAKAGAELREADRMIMEQKAKLAEQLQVEAEAYNRTEHAGRALNSTLDTQERLAREARDAHFELAVGLEGLSKAEIGNAAIGELNRMLDEGTIDPEVYADAVKRVGTEFLGMTQAEVDAAAFLPILMTEFREGQGDVDILTNAVNRHNAALRRNIWLQKQLLTLMGKEVPELPSASGEGITTGSGSYAAGAAISQFGGPLRGAATEVGEAGTEGILTMPDGSVVVVDHKRWMRMRGQFFGARQMQGGGVLIDGTVGTGGTYGTHRFKDYSSVQTSLASKGSFYDGGDGGSGGQNQMAYRRAQDEAQQVAAQVAYRAAGSVAATVSAQLAAQAGTVQAAQAQAAQASRDARDTQQKLDELIAEVKKGSKDSTLGQVGRQIERAVA
jgi:hypothetical protein